MIYKDLHFNIYLSIHKKAGTLLHMYFNATFGVHYPMPIEMVEIISFIVLTDFLNSRLCLLIEASVRTDLLMNKI